MSSRKFRISALAGLLLAVPATARPQASEPSPPHRQRSIEWIQNDGDSLLLPEHDGPLLLFHGEQMARGYLGVRLDDMTPELRAYFGAPKEAGVLVEAVEPDSPAAKAGIKVGDVITTVDGDNVDSVWSVTRVVRRKKSGESVSLGIVRARHSEKMSVAVAERKKEEIDVGRMLGDRKLRGHRLLLGEPADKAFERLDRFLSSPEWKARIESLDDCDRIRTRVDDLEKRLKDLEKKLAKK
jgi:membrane-associated protease RseP (regulator of RpoE activity)